jgi:2-polyprenyl-3-methyl-5-hydroxy-6-metoxy-1,4-benzoquinol methylase
MKNSTCIVCFSTAVKIVRVNDDLKYLACKVCGHCEKVDSYLTKKVNFEDAQTKYFGKDSLVFSVVSSPFEAEILKKRGEVITRHLEEGSSVIEVGPGAGTFLKWLNEKGYRVTAVEHAPELARYITDRLNVPVHVGEFETVEVDSSSVDAFCSFHVIEHVLDPVVHLAKAFDVVRSGGYAFLATPNARSWEQRVSGHLSPNYDFAHLRVFSQNSLRQICEAAGWTVLEVRTPEYSIGWLRISSKILRRLRREHEGDTAGKYATGSSQTLRVFAFVVDKISWPLRFVQSIFGGGNELFFVLKK